MSVCSERLMRTTLWPDALAIAMQSEVLPTPGLPSRRMGLRSCRPAAVERGGVCARKEELSVRKAAAERTRLHIQMHKLRREEEAHLAARA